MCHTRFKTRSSNVVSFIRKTFASYISSFKQRMIMFYILLFLALNQNHKVLDYEMIVKDSTTRCEEKFFNKFLYLQVKNC